MVPIRTGRAGAASGSATRRCVGGASAPRTRDGGSEGGTAAGSRTAERTGRTRRRGQAAGEWSTRPGRRRVLTVARIAAVTRPMDALVLFPIGFPCAGGVAPGPHIEFPRERHRVPCAPGAARIHREQAAGEEFDPAVTVGPGGGLHPITAPAVAVFRGAAYNELEKPGAPAAFPRAHPGGTVRSPPPRRRSRTGSSVDASGRSRPTVPGRPGPGARA